MKRIFVTAASLVAIALAGCQAAANHLALTVHMEGAQVQAGPKEVMLVPSNTGEAVHRILKNSSGKALFAYDIKAGKDDGAGNYHFLLAPAAGTIPTFESTRELAVKAGEESVKVELMEQPGTGRKIADVLQVNAFESHSAIQEHLIRFHSMIRAWVHGE